MKVEKLKLPKADVHTFAMAVGEAVRSKGPCNLSLTRTYNDLTVVTNDVIKGKEELVKKHAKMDENGDYVLKEGAEGNIEEGIMFDMMEFDTSQEEMQKELDEYFREEVEVNIYTVSLDKKVLVPIKSNQGKTIYERVSLEEYLDSEVGSGSTTALLIDYFIKD